MHCVSLTYGGIIVSSKDAARELNCDSYVSVRVVCVCVCMWCVCVCMWCVCEYACGVCVSVHVVCV